MPPLLFLIAGLLAPPIPTGAGAAPVIALAPTPLSWTGTPPPFPRRHRAGVKGMKPKYRALIDLSAWPDEPEAPEQITAQAFGPALATLCGNLSARNAEARADLMLQMAAQFDVDVFLLAALTYRVSRCRRRSKGQFGTGLGMVHTRMHRGQLRDREYRYQVFEGGAWAPKTLRLERYPFYPGLLTKAAPNLYFTAALLAVAKAQCPHNDGAFGSVPHRHFVSHYAWGDRVEDLGFEDRVLEARRRLIEYYSGRDLMPRALFEVPEAKGDADRPNEGADDVPLLCPLDAPPRKVLSVPGEDRDHGRHRGIDFVSAGGEPVRAVAPGRVSFAGVDMPSGPSFRLTPQAARKFKRKRMGRGGLFVMVRHASGLTSAYMHLSTLEVETGAHVEAGQLIGRVGRTGCKSSGAHLHFELRRDGRHLNPMDSMGPYVFGPDALWAGRRAKIWRKAQRKAKRRARRKARARRRARRKGTPKAQR